MTDAQLFSDPARKHFEDFLPGDRMISRGRTIGIGDITSFAGLTGNYYPLHTDAALMESSKFGQRVCHGSLTYSIAVGLIALSGFYGDAIRALVEVTSIKASRPVFADDTLKVVAVVVTTQAETAGSGTLSVAYSVRNQRDEEVMTFLQTMLARRRHQE